MRDYGKVHTLFWSSPDIRGLSDDGRLLALYLLTCPHGTIAGVFRAPDGYVSEDLQWGSERVAEGFRNLADAGFATRCEQTKWVWITQFLDWNPPENPNQRKAMAKVVDTVPDQCSWKSGFMRVCGHFLGETAAKNRKGSETLSEPFRNQEQEQEQEKKKKMKKKNPAPAPDFDPLAVELPDGLPESEWHAWIAYRRHRRLTCTEITITRQLEALRHWQAKGFNPVDIVGTAMRNGWQGLFEPRLAAPGLAPPEPVRRQAREVYQ